MREDIKGTGSSPKADTGKDDTKDKDDKDKDDKDKDDKDKDDKDKDDKDKDDKDKDDTGSGSKAKVTTISSWLKGYSIEVDSTKIGIEGTGSDASDGTYVFYVEGNQQHFIKVNHPQFWKSWTDFFVMGGDYTGSIDVPGRVVLNSN